MRLLRCAKAVAFGGGHAPHRPAQHADFPQPHGGAEPATRLIIMAASPFIEPVHEPRTDREGRLLIRVFWHVNVAIVPRADEIGQGRGNFTEGRKRIPRRLGSPAKAIMQKKTSLPCISSGMNGAAAQAQRGDDGQLSGAGSASAMKRLTTSGVAGSTSGPPGEGRQSVQPELPLRNHAKVAAAAAQRPEKFRVVFSSAEMSPSAVTSSAARTSRW